MKIQMQINRQKENDKIVETFSIYPHWSGSFDKQKALYYALWKLSHDLGIGDQYKLIERKELTNNIINVYAYEPNKMVPKLSDSFDFIYFPFLGEKKCSKCIHMRIMKDKNSYCKLRGKRLKKDFWYKCDYRQEIFQGNNVRNSET